MSILIIGDHPKTIGGVTNYTRPLALTLSKTNKVYYLYNSARTFNLDFGKARIIKIDNFDEFESFELINSQGLEKNYDNLEVDTSCWMDALFKEFLIKYNIKIIHINEIFGFSSSIIKVATANGVKCIVTVHEYWWLCTHRVMVDYNNIICDGPDNIRKCSYCIQDKLKTFNSRKIKFREKVKNSTPTIYKLISFLKKLSKLIKIGKANQKYLELDFGTRNYNDSISSKLEIQVLNRLKKNIDALNNTHLIIAVSSDVKRILTKYGVNHEKILIQHIGSTIANQYIAHTKEVDSENVVFGFIGGVSYYKGIHQLVDAYMSLPERYLKKSRLEIFGKYSTGYYNSMNLKYIKNNHYTKNIIFHGKYNPQDIPLITNKIDIMVLPSLCADTAPQTIFESFSCNLPIIAPKIGGFTDFIAHMVNGLIYETASVQSLTEALERIIDKPQIIDKLRNGIPKMKTIEDNTKELFEIYSQL